MTSSASSHVFEDLRDERVPPALYWTGEQVSAWIEELGFPQYKPCFTTNCIDGRRLITLQASRLPEIGITDFKHIMTISNSVRELLELEEPFWNRSISLPPRNEIGMYLEKKSVRGKIIDNMSFQKFLLTVQSRDPKWQPPLSNQCAIIAHNVPAIK
ncbi:sterile alpha motif domain-containing protein 15 [Patella vulgata]|uniref:sterile alpha motif domain-containing protein 15 n=1 Tax=Patella vulgata TaxID=6465 RepID=UPI00217F9C77|nr:sterile alpha motif domain-containing protein 15 [Patella vulgata]